jgi:TrmH RNA methyltransferase
VCIHGDAHRAALTPAAVRIAEGAAEQIDIARIPDLDAFLSALRREGVAVFSADPRGERDAFDVRWPARTVLVFGSEARGLSPAIQDEIDMSVSIRGTDAVESINVSVAAGIIMAAWLRRR